MQTLSWAVTDGGQQASQRPHLQMRRLILLNVK